jgi:DNA-binding transcriptional ArsR family regulator
MGRKKTGLTDEMIEAVSARFRLLGEPLRLRLLENLDSSEVSVNDLADAVGAGQPNVSRHLNALFEGGLVGRRREGNSTYYSIADPIVFDVRDMICGSVRNGARTKWKALEGPVKRRRSSV